MTRISDPLLPPSSQETPVRNSWTNSEKILMAISIIMAVGLLLTCCLNVPWVVPVIFFALTLAPLLSFGRPGYPPFAAPSASH